MEPRRSSAALGILYAEDFGLDQTLPPPKPAPVVVPPALTQADIDNACIRAVKAAEAAWSAGAAERRTEALAVLVEGLAGAQQAASQHAEAVADGITRTILSMLAGVLPYLCRAHGDDEVRALMAKLAPLLARNTRLIVRVHPGLIDILAADLATLDDSLVPQIELRPANLPPGDVRLAWEDGNLVRDTTAICSTLQEGLAQLGLTNPFETADLVTSSGSFELAQ